MKNTNNDFSELINRLKAAKIISISIDPGFDNFKILVNDMEYIDASNIIPYDEKKKIGSNIFKKDNGLVTLFNNGNEYIVGLDARYKQSLGIEGSKEYAKSKGLANLSVEERFTYDDFLVMFKAHIAAAITKYALKENIAIEELANWTIIPSIALPHSLFISFVEDEPKGIERVVTLRKYLTDSSDFSICLSGTTYNLQLNKIKPLSVFSQAHCILYVHADKCDRENKNIKFPVVIFDGGYRTDGIMLVRHNWDTEGDESNTDYAMYNINKKVADKLTTLNVPDMYEHNIDTKQKESDIQYYRDTTTNKPISVSISEIKDNIIKETSDELMKHLAANFNDLMFNGTFLIGGGTGAAYSEHIKTWMHLNNEGVDMDIFDVVPEFAGKELPPIMAVAVGMQTQQLVSLELANNSK